MFYVIQEATGQILEAIDGYRPPDPQAEADYYNCAVFIIRGEHTGLSAEPSGKKEEEAE